ncbi:MAG: hypothetical protein SFY95_04260 [Planctomycetota bacterium]|nr:hypothetical protein [Planctomycetota bacterium]
MPVRRDTLIPGPRRSLGALVALAAIVAASGLACAQNALGDGRGLQRDLNTAGAAAGNVNSRSRFADEVRFRNAIITGNAPGGMSFRGDVRYRAPDDFRGRLGSDDLYAFRRDSLYSGLGGMGIRGTDALQYQFGLSTGRSGGGDLFGGVIATRQGGFASYSPPRTGGVGSAPIDVTSATRRAPRDESPILGPGESLSRRTSIDGSLRSTASYLSGRSLQTAVLGERRAPGVGMETVEASPLVGVRTRPSDMPGAKSAGILAGGKAADPSAPKPKPADKPAQEPSDSRTPLDRLRPAPTPEGATTIENRLSRLREALRERDEADQQAAQARTREALDPETLKVLRELASQAGLPAERAGEPLTPGAPPETAPLRDERGRLRSLIELDPKVRIPVTDRYAQHMRDGQTMLGAGRYFDAEERFTRALSARPGDASARLGRAHAQLGAGMFISAAVNLRELLAEKPELAGVRYAPELLPAPARGVTVTLQHREALKDADTAKAAALLLAYMGYQGLTRETLDGPARTSPDPQAIREGLDALERSPAATESDRALVQLLRSVWLAPGGRE